MKKVLVIITLFYSMCTYAQYSISGKIVEKETEKPVDFGNIILYAGEEFITSTEPDKSGEFKLEHVSGGNYSLVVQIIGYEKYKTRLTVNENKNLGMILLTPESFELEGVVVVAEKQQVVYKLDRKFISAASNIIASSGGNATDILSRVPSVRVDPDGNVSFRGSSGFLVQINGKPSMFNAAQALQQIPASQIENIEIITTPSARNQTDGDAGIINIITKQQLDDGLSGAINAYGSTYGSRGVDFILSKKAGEHQLKFGGIYGQRFRKSDFEQEKTTFVDDNSITSHSKGPRQGEFRNYILQAGWQLNKKQTNYYVDLTGGYEAYINKGDLTYSEQVNQPGTEPLFNEYTSKDDYDLHETILAGSAGFNHNFNTEGHTIKGHFYAKYGGNAMEYFSSDLLDKNQNRAQGHQAWEAEHRWTIDGRLDYVWPYSKSGRMETGYQYSSYLEDGDYKMEYWNPQTQQFDYRDDIYNTFYFQRGLHTVYLLLNQRFGKFELQAGVRGEHTHQVLRSSKEWANRTENRFELFPSVHAGYHPNETTSFMAAYSRRTNRPQLFFMEPYITFRDYYTAEIGNPDIRPEYINVYELTFKKNIGDNTLHMAVFHRNRKDKIERLRIPYEAGITLDSMANVGSDYSTGVELGVNVKPVKAWNVTLNGNLYHYKVKNKLASGGKNESSVNVGFSLYNNVQIAKNTMVQLDGNFVGPTVRTQGQQDGFFYADFGIRQQLFASKLVAGLSFRNFLNTAKYKSNIDTHNLQSHTTILPKFPLITLNISYTFNNFKQRTRGREGSDFFEGTNY